MIDHADKAWIKQTNEPTEQADEAPRSKLQQSVIKITLIALFYGVTLAALL